VELELKLAGRSVVVAVDLAAVMSWPPAEANLYVVSTLVEVWTCVLAREEETYWW
jgi:hypothetical protein